MIKAKRFFSNFVMAIFLLGISGCSSLENSKGGFMENPETVEFNGKVYVQTFGDDFSSDKLNLSNWEKCPEWQRQDRGGFWSNDCSYVKDGNLVIEARKQDGKLVSGAVRSNGKFEQNYGLYKIRFMIDKKTSGLWYAFWLMSHSVDKIGGGAIDGGEIDIFEVLPNDVNLPAGKRTYLNSAVHWDGYHEYHKSKGSMFVIDDSFYGKWHEVTFEWTPTSYNAYLDDSETPYWSVTGETVKEYGGIVTTKNYIKITAEYGTWAGPMEDNAIPAHMYVDYVKAYAPQK